MSRVDIHSHILSGFDDGASSDAESLEMARAAVKGGTSLMAATPHYDIENPAYELEHVSGEVARLNLLLIEEGIPLTLVPGLEVRISAGLHRLAMHSASGSAACGPGWRQEPFLPLQSLTLGGSGVFLLLDLPMGSMPIATPEILFQIRLSGFHPVLAHPERNRHLLDNPGLLSDFCEQGALLQVNSGSLTGIFGRETRREALRLVSSGTAHLVASDSHSVRARGPSLEAAASVIGKAAGRECARCLLEDNPARVLKGIYPLEAPPAGPSGNRKPERKNRKRGLKTKRPSY